MKQQIQQLLERALEGMGLEETVSPQVTVPENPAHGDYSTNVAMLLAGKLKKSPREIAEGLKNAIQKDQTISRAGIIDRVEIAPPGFINLFLSEANLVSQVSEALKKGEAYGFSPKPAFIKASGGKSRPKKGSEKGEKTERKIGSQPGGSFPSKTAEKTGIFPRKNAARKYPGRQNNVGESARSSETIPESAQNRLTGDPPKRWKRIMVEFAHPNTHKAFHIGHLRNITTGESIVRLLESQGNEVIRVNYQGDVGMHIAKALYALLELVPYKDQVKEITGVHERVEFLGKAYAAGSTAFEASDEVKKTIGEINIKIYAKNPSVYPLYRKTRQWSLDYFDEIYRRLGTHYDRFYFESEFYELGKKYVTEGIKKGIFEESKGAIIFPGEKLGLHNRVFVTGEGNATYEGKEIGLGRVQFDEYDPDLIIHVVGPEQAAYFQVLFKALEQVFPDTSGKEYHLIYGWVKLKEGKMSSRLGNVVLGEWLLDEAKKSIYKILETTRSSEYTQELRDEIAEKAAVAAVKYSFLRVGVSGDIAFDLEASVSFEGDSGPYLQYTYARARSVLRKAQNISHLSNISHLGNLEERALARAIMQFPDIVADAAENFAPNTLCTYLFHLAQQFNLFYAHNPILGDPKRLTLASATAQVLHNGLYLLGIETLEQM